MKVFNTRSKPSCRTACNKSRRMVRAAPVPPCRHLQNGIHLQALKGLLLVLLCCCAHSSHALLSSQSGLFLLQKLSLCWPAMKLPTSILLLCMALRVGTAKNGRGCFLLLQTAAEDKAMPKKGDNPVTSVHFPVFSVKRLSGI